MSGGGTAGAGAAPSARQLRRVMRRWRRRNAGRSLADAFSDAYIAAVAVVLVGAWLGSLIVTGRSALQAACTTAGCAAARSALPWLTSGGVVAGTLVLAAMLGPVLVSPAAGSWLLSAPVDRAGLLRPAFAAAGATAAVAGAVWGAAVTAFAGYPGPVVGGTAVGVAMGCLAAVGAGAVAQAQRSALARGAGVVMGAAVWLGVVLLVATGPASVVAGVGPAALSGRWVTVAAGALLVVAVVAVTWAVRGLGRIRRTALVLAGTTAESLSGAMAALDLALLRDVVVSRRWTARGRVRVAAGRGAGWQAVVWRDLVRLRRSSRSWVLLFAALVVPYLAAHVGLARFAAPIAVITGFVGSLGLYTGLRTLANPRGIGALFPMSGSVTRCASTVVPSVVVLAWSLAGIPALHSALPGETWSTAVLTAVAVALAVVTAGTRWVTGRPADYAKPLVALPGGAGALPPDLLAVAFRGLDVVVVTATPLLISNAAGGAVVSLIIAAAVFAYLLARP